MQPWAKQNCAWIRVEVQWCGRDKWEKAHTSSSDPLLWWTLLSPDYLQAPQFSHGIFLHRVHITVQTLALLTYFLAARSLWLIWREMHMTNREAVPAKFPGLFHSFLSQSQDLPLCKHRDVNTVGEESPPQSLQELRWQSWRSRGDRVRLWVGQHCFYLLSCLSQALIFV